MWFLFPKKKNFDRIAHELHCHHPCYKSFTHGNSCNFRNASPKLVTTPLSTSEIKFLMNAITQSLSNIYQSMFLKTKEQFPWHCYTMFMVFVCQAFRVKMATNYCCAIEGRKNAPFSGADILQVSVKCPSQ